MRAALEPHMSVLDKSVRCPIILFASIQKSVEPALNAVVLAIDPAARPQGRSGNKMNVHPFSRGTERLPASVRLAGSCSSIDRDAAVSSLPLTSGRLKAERRKAEAGFRSSDNR
jgi:hypothetical protein